MSQSMVAPQPESIPENTPDFSLKAELAGEIQLEVDRKGMVALVKKTNYFDQTITPREIIKQLKDQGIIHGIVEEEKIDEFIRSRGFKGKFFKIASGTTPKPGNDARIEYYFDTDYLKVGGEGKDGKMDFKESGEVPWVKEGTLLAETFPMTESGNGANIFNHMTVVPLAVDLPLKFKSGVTPSEDRLKLYSEISGHPRLGMSGNIEVTSTFTVKTDINYKAVHLEYEGNIDIKGILRDGFRIKGQAIRIDTVDGGEIYALGDVTVLNGVNGAKVYAQGNVSAKFIQNSQICCMGNLSVTREIVNCNIETSGAVLIPRGDVISSQIECNKGIFAQQIGTDMSVPNTITAGVDTFTKKESDAIDRRIFTCKDRLGKIRTKTEKSTLEIKECNGLFTKILATRAGLADREKDKRRYLKLMEKLDAAIITILGKTDQYLAGAHCLMGPLDLSYPTVMGENIEPLRRDLTWLFLNTKPGKGERMAILKNLGLAQLRYRLKILFNYPDITLFAGSFQKSGTYSSTYFDIFRFLFKTAVEQLTREETDMGSIERTLKDLARASDKLVFPEEALKEEKQALQKAYVSLILKMDMAQLDRLISFCDLITRATQNRTRKIMDDVRPALIAACYTRLSQEAAEEACAKKMVTIIKKYLNAYALNYKPHRNFYRNFFDTRICLGSQPVPVMAQLITSRKPLQRPCSWFFPMKRP